MSRPDDLQRLKAHLAQNTATPFVLKQSDAEYCVCYLLLDGFAGTLKLIRRYLCAKLAEWCAIGAGKNFCYRLGGAKIGRGVVIAPGVVLDYLCLDLIEIGDDSILGMGCMLLAHEFTFAESRIGRVRIGQKVIVGARAVIRCGIHVGDGATVGMASLVTRDVRPGATVCGIPARERGDGQTEGGILKYAQR